MSVVETVVVMVVETAGMKVVSTVECLEYVKAVELAVWSGFCVVDLRASDLADDLAAS